MKIKNTIKLICSDIDGTLLDANRDISPATAETFKALGGKIPIVLASSRMPSAMYYIQEKLGISATPLIAYNGGLILDKSRKTLYSATLSLRLLAQTIDHHQNKNYNISTFSGDVWRTEAMDQWTLREINNTRAEPELLPLDNLMHTLEKKSEKPHKIMCMGVPEELDDLLKNIGDSDLKQEADFYRSKTTYLEISAKNVNKSKALQLLLDEVYGFKMEETMSFGDNHNDIELLENAGFGVAMANATDNAKEVADLVSDRTNKEDAVADVIKKFIF